MERMSSLTLGKLTALFTALAVMVAVVAGGQRIFSPGGLSVKNRTKVVQGGVRSHAEIGSCSACHTSPWSGTTMAQRCLDCHADIRQQIDGKQSLHGLLANGKECRVCHTEHKGAHGVLTRFTHFDHDCTAFKLTGKHAAVACISCHKDSVYRGTPHACASCHAEPVSHHGKFGKNCAQCHTTLSWSGSDFKHPFPMNHANAMKKGQGCAICHSDANNFVSYTCYNCHRHEPARTLAQHGRRKIPNIDKCADCHFRGRRPVRAQLDALEGDDWLFAFLGEPDRDRSGCASCASEAISRR